MEDFASPPCTLPRTTLAALEVTGDGCSSGSGEREGTSALESQRKDSSQTQWTDEKHSLYLKSMEASFVNQLYSSSDLRSWLSQKGCSSDSISSRKMHTGNPIPSGQFKVLQGGCWSKRNFGGESLQLNEADGPRFLLTNPWIQHFTTGCRHQTVPSPSLQEHIATAIPLRQFPASQANLCRQDSVGSNEGVAEVIDQNFVDEDVAIEKASRPRTRKRMKNSVVASSSNDQVVPLRSFPLLETAEKCVPAKK